eukprot:1313661-Prymnesium_polylepis.1
MNVLRRRVARDAVALGSSLAGARGLARVARADAQLELQQGALEKLPFLGGLQRLVPCAVVEQHGRVVEQHKRLGVVGGILPVHAVLEAARRFLD